MATFRTAGDLGDCLHSLPAVRFHGGGEIFWHAENWTREPMTVQRWALLAPLLEAQPYVHRTGPWDGKPTDFNLNDFRAGYFGEIRRWGGNLQHPNFPRLRNLCEWACRAHGVPLEGMGKAWLQVEPNRVAAVVFNRTSRYQNKDWSVAKVAKLFGDDAVFIGNRLEYLQFRRLTLREIPHLKTANLLEAARVIAGADLFIGNQSACYAIAEGLKKPALLEVCPWLPNCLFSRPDVWHYWNHKFDFDSVCTPSPTSA